MKYGNNLIINLDSRIVFYDLKTILNNRAFSIIVDVGTNLIDPEKIPKSTGIIIRVNNLWNSHFAIEFQSKFVLSRIPDFVIFKSSDNEKPEDFEDEIKLARSSATLGYGIDLGTSGNFELIDKYLNILDELPSYIFAPLNPLKYKSEIIDFCNKNDILLISTEVYGNPESEEWMKETFTMDYLEKFSLIHGSGIELKTSSKTIDFISTLSSINNYMGEKLEEDKENLFQVSKDVWSDIVKPAKRKIKATGMEILNSRFNWSSNRNSGRVILSFSDESRIDEKILDNARKLDSFEMPEYFSEEDKKNYSDMFCISMLSSENPGRKIIYDRQGDITIITLKKRYLPWVKNLVFVCSYYKNIPIIIKI